MCCDVRRWMDAASQEEEADVDAGRRKRSVFIDDIADVDEDEEEEELDVSAPLHALLLSSACGEGGLGRKGVPVGGLKG